MLSAAAETNAASVIRTPWCSSYFSFNPRRIETVSSTVGYLTPTGMYLALTQSNADEEKLVASIQPNMVPTGTQDVDGVSWVAYEGDGDTEYGTGSVSQAGSRSSVARRCPRPSRRGRQARRPRV